MGFFEWALALASAYLLCGAAFALPFHARGALQIDPAARGAGFAFRVLITPGVIALWPVLLQKWRRFTGILAADPERPFSQGRLRRAHQVVWVLATLIIPTLVLVALAVRPEPQPTAPQSSLTP